jgi:hypothetical protein
MNTNNQIYKQLTNFRMYIISILFGAIGLVLLVLADMIDWGEKLSLQTLLRDIGSLLIASVAISIIWELFSKRSFYAEAIATTKLVDDINISGLTGVAISLYGDIDWRKMFNSTNEIKLLFMYGRTWRNFHEEDLINFAKRRNTKTIVVLPDPANVDLFISAAQRIGIKPSELASSVQIAQADFIRIFSKTGNENGKLEVWFIPFVPVYSYYGFGEKAFITIYQHRLERHAVPGFLVEKGGTLYEFFEQDFEAITNGENPRGRKVFPSK